MAPSKTPTRTSSRIRPATSSAANKKTLGSTSSMAAMTPAKKGRKTAPTPSPAKKTSTAAPKGSGRKRAKQEDSEDDKDEEEEDEEDEEDEAESDNYGDDNEAMEDNDEEEDDSDDDDFQSSDDVRTRKSSVKKTKASSKKQATSATKSSSSANPAKKAKTSSTATSPKKPTANKNQPKPEPTKTFLTSPLKIPRPKGGHPVADAIQPETLEFLRDLKLNNDREYMMLNQERCDQAKADFVDFLRMVKDGLLEADPDVMDQEPKQCMMRIHRDIRFSNDKTPYKDRFSCFFSKGGKKSIAAGYYFGVASNGQTFVGCGAWDIGSAALTRVRHGIVDHADRFNSILATDAIKRITGGKTGIEALREGPTPLKTGPKGFDKDHPMIEFLKRKSFAVGRNFEDREVVNEGFLEEVLSTFDACVDLVHIINDWIG
ncbi:hypothetical protein EC957_002569 [Mortierella hygrophila]|uniref:Uncharacterized protein n=1 Tax=Mortierella hygrophila TaxID=979708 RepID=A0A9P6F3A4_9FUNG|nr:hypothetical protein EC957_002569 [Mortierella hygrophila]